MKNDYYFEITDTFNGEANYCWVNHLKITAKSLHGALIKLSKHTGFNFRLYDNFCFHKRYNAKNETVCAFLIGIDDDSLENELNFYRLF